MVVAAFDVDGTLTTRDCVRPFLERAAGRRRLVTSMLRRPLATVVAAVRRDRDRLKEIIVGGSLRGKLIADVERRRRAVRPVRPRQLVATRHVAPACAGIKQAGHRDRARVGLAGRLSSTHSRCGSASTTCCAPIRRERGSVRRPAWSGPTAAPTRSGGGSTSGSKNSGGSTPRCGHTATVPATVSCWTSADHAVWVNGATISEIPEVVAG